VLTKLRSKIREIG